MVSMVMSAFMMWVATPAWASGGAWEPGLDFAPSAAGRTDAVAVTYGADVYVLGGTPYRCPAGGGCADPERGAVDVWAAGGTGWAPGEGFDSMLGRLGAGVDALGRLVAFGGAQGDDLTATDKAFVYDIVLGEEGEPSLSRRLSTVADFAWASDASRRLYALGGGPGASASVVQPNVAFAERYVAGADTWEAIAPLPLPRSHAAATHDGFGRILVFGGYDELGLERTDTVQAFDVATGTWEILGALPTPPDGDARFSDQRAALGHDGLVYVVGGRNGPVGTGTTRPYVMLFDPLHETWSFGPDLATPREAMALTVDADGWLHALGGRDGGAGLWTSARLSTLPAGTECTEHVDCDDGLLCTGDESCIDGTCYDGAPIECGVDEICNRDGTCIAQRFDLVPLPVFPTQSSVLPLGINDLEEVVGSWFDPDDGAMHGFLYDGGLHDLGRGTARAINDDGWIAGDDGTAWVRNPVTGARTDLGTLGGATSTSDAISSARHIAGQSTRTSGDPHAFQATTGGMTDLGTLGTYSKAHGVNAAGVVVGETLVNDWDPHAEPFVWSGGAMEIMGGTWVAGSARAIHDDGTITGWTSGHPDHWGHAFRYDGTFVDLGSYYGKAYSIGRAVNAFDTVVGYAFGEWVQTHCCGSMWSNAIHRAFLHDGQEGFDPNDLLPEGSGWTLIDLTGVSDTGVIAGRGTHDGQSKGFLLVPHDTVATPVLVAEPLVRDQTARVEVHQAPPNAQVMLVRSTSGVGPGPCPAALGGDCLSLLSPVRVLARARADAAGLALFDVRLPASAPLTTVGLQAVVPSGPIRTSRPRVVRILP